MITQWVINHKRQISLIAYVVMTTSRTPFNILLICYMLCDDEMTFETSCGGVLFKRHILIFLLTLLLFGVNTLHFSV